MTRFPGLGLWMLLIGIPIADAQLPTSPPQAHVGSTACATCHPKEDHAWRTSQHRRAMQVATRESILGNFENARFRHAGVTSRFFHRNGRYYVNTDGPDGQLADFEIRYTFGVEPLQQYLIEMPDGRLQALSIAWDVVRKRWFHLYPKEHIDHNDELHWTRPAQNWNAMCADCHSTGLRKSYDMASDRFRTSWSEISVGCEACHGPGSRHIGWAAARDGKRADTDATKGLVAKLDERRGVVWAREARSVTATRSEPRKSEREIDVCAQCHSRRAQIADGYVADKPFLDYYRPALLTAALYHPDGQQQAEVYDWGSFLQSRMYAAGVTCSDCHEPHSGRLRAEGNALCGQCHAPPQFDNPAHHHHASGSAGAQCANCHMPSATYMVIDPRHDHSLRVPRPDVSAKLGTPNACNACHANRDTQWAATQLRTWFGHDPQGYQRFAAVFADSNAGAVGAAKALRATAGDPAAPSIARATALSRLDANANSATLDLVVAGLRDPNPLIRMGALDALSAAPAALRSRYVVPLLADPLRSIRIAAAAALADVSLASATQEQRAAFDRAASDYVDSQRYNGDRADARVNLATFEALRGDVASAERDFRSAMALDPLFAPAYVNLADLYRARGRDAEGMQVLRKGLQPLPKNAALHHALGLALVRAKRTDQALQELAQAVKLDPGNARFAYVYGVALHSAGRVDAATEVLVRASAAHPADADILGALASFYRDRGNNEQAQRYADRLRSVEMAR